MEIRLRLPGLSPAHDVDLAGKAAAAVAALRHGLSTPSPIPPHAENECERQGCTYLGRIVDPTGQVWLLYQCGDLVEMYPA